MGLSPCPFFQSLTLFFVMALSKSQVEFIKKKRRSMSVDAIASRIKAPKPDVKRYLDELRPQLSPGRKRLFTIIAATIPVLFFVILEVALRIFNYGGNLDLFISAPGGYSDYYMCNPEVGRRYFFMQNTVPDLPNDLFLKEKPANSYRIFALGGSTTAGYPYGSNIMFPRILNYRLADVFPDRIIEVVNVAMTAVNTYTVADFLDEILAKEADALLIYSGHNEFYGALGAASYESLGQFRPFVKFYLKLQRAKTFILIRDMIGNLRAWSTRVFSEGDVADPSATLMERMVANQTITLDSDTYTLGRRQFEQNLRDILKQARDAGVNVIISDLVSNVRDIKPFVSVATEALPPAETIYREGVNLEKKQDYDGARKAYVYAKDLDALRFRASEDFNQVISDVAAEFEVPVVPMKAYFEKASPNGLIGNHLMLEHLHPNLDGYFLMADAFFDAMRRAELISTEWDPARIRAPEYYREKWGFTELDKAYSDIRIEILKGGWPFKPRSAPNRAMLAYRPKSRVDSLAYKAWRDDSFNLEHAHVELAEYYEGQGDFLKAYEEYKALSFITPLNDSPYLHAADMLIKARELGRALPYLHEALELGESAFANKWIGQIYLDSGRTQEALPFLEKAAKLAPQDAQLIYNLSGAYALDRQYEKAKRYLDILAELRPNFPGAADLRQQLDNL